MSALIKIRKLFTVDALLFVVSLIIYLFYFHPVLLNLNSLLSGVTLDTLKNYYTFLYHTTDGGSWLTFNGMNYPFGEHLTYTDCQPVFCWILRPFAFAHPFLIGILHFLMFFSHIINPNILLRIFRRANMEQWPAAACALGIALLSPQFLKIQAGHHSLSYACIIPLNILLLHRLILHNRRSDQFLLFIFNTLLYFIHPYFGFSVSLFSFFTLMFNGSFYLKFSFALKKTGQAIILSLLPLLLFKLFMLLTDRNIDRPEEPIGVNFMIENIQSLLSPDFGPLKEPTEKLFTKKPTHFEGHTYLGLAMVLTTVVLIMSLLFARRRPKIDKSTTATFLSALILLMLAFGYHFDLMATLKIQSNAFNQFRATCRFAWFFYYALPVFILPLIFRNFQIPRYIIYATSSLFLAISMLEANYLFKHDESAYWRFANFFREEFLTEEQKQLVSKIRAAKPQALIPLPLFHGGSEIYDRMGTNNSMTPAMLFSYHCRLSILSVSLSRTSASETEALIESLNSYKRNRTVDSLFDQRDFIIMKTSDPLLPDEERLLTKASMIQQFDSITLLKISSSDLKRPAISAQVLEVQVKHPSTANVIYVNTANRKPFLNASLIDIEMITSTEPKQIPTGPQIISLHFYYNRKHYKAVAGNLIIAKVTENGSEWVSNIPLRILSGFYPGYGVFEYEVQLSSDERYQFLIQGWQEEQYRISDFMLRSAAQTVLLKNGKDTISINNFPLH